MNSIEEMNDLAFRKEFDAKYHEHIGVGNKQAS